MVTGTPSASASRKRLVLLFSLQSAEVMLPRQPSVRDTDGIVLRGSFVIKHRNAPAAGGHRFDQTGIEFQALELFTCAPGGLSATASTKSSSGAAILAPADISFRASRGPSHGSAKTEVALQAQQAIELYISYQDCKLALEILHSLRAASARAQRSLTAVPPEPAASSGSPVGEARDAAPAPAAATAGTRSVLADGATARQAAPPAPPPPPHRRRRRRRQRRRRCA